MPSEGYEQMTLEKAIGVPRGSASRRTGCKRCAFWSVNAALLTIAMHLGYSAE
jgi:hypothetical protein